MAIETATVSKTLLQLASPNGLVTRTVLEAPPRDADPSEIPIIDISGIHSDSFEERKRVAQEVRNAATNIGFFYIKNHGMPEEVIQGAYQSGLDFFRQDLSLKMPAKATGSDSFAGYFPSEAMHINPFEVKDAKEMFITRYDPRYDPNVEDVEAIPENVSSRFKYKDTPWEGTSSCPQFKEAMIKYYQEGLKLTRALMRTFALSLELPEDYFDEKMKYPNINTNINYYPAMPEIPGQAKRAPSSFGSHTDFQVVTVLWQDEVGGLQVLNKEGRWINAPPIPGTFVVNIADLMQRITNDLYVSTVHRAQNWTGRERVSMPLATGFGNHDVVGVVPTCVGPNGEKKYEDLTVDAWVTRRLDNMIRLANQLKQGN